MIPEEIMKSLIQDSAQPLYIAFYLLMSRGLRAGEILNLKIVDDY